MTEPTNAQEYLSPYRKQMFQSWKQRLDGVPYRDVFAKREKELLEELRSVFSRQLKTEEKISSFFKAYWDTVEQGAPELSFEVPEQYHRDVEPPADESVLDEKPPSDILEDAVWAYNAPSNANPDDAPSKGAWRWYQFSKQNPAKFMEMIGVRFIDRLSESQDEQKSRDADFDKAVRLLEKAAKPDLPEEDYREVRQVLRGRTKGS